MFIYTNVWLFPTDSLQQYRSHMIGNGSIIEIERNFDENNVSEPYNLLQHDIEKIIWCCSVNPVENDMHLG